MSSMNMKVMLMGLVIVTAVLKTKAAEMQNTRIQCWHCGSDVGGAENFCGDEFNEDNIPWDTLKERNLSIMRTCNSTINSQHERAVCRKTVEDVDGKLVIKRFCYYTDKMDSLTHCMEEPTEKNVHRIFCEDCLTDKCNGANYMTSSISGAVTFLLALFMGQNVNV